MAFSYSARTHPGLRRDDNEDSYCARPDLGLFAVADGLGGHAAGQVASGVAVDALEAFMGGAIGLEECARYEIDPAPSDAGARLSDAFRVANGRIGLLVSGRPELHGMATTLAAVVFEPATSGDTLAGEPSPGEDADCDTPSAIVAHIGDTRVYRWSAGRLVQVTVDHSWVGEQVRAGLLTAAEARVHPWRSVVTRAMSGSGSLPVDFSRVALGHGDRLLICSDGLSSVLTDAEIEQLLAQESDDGAACDVLVQAANLAGGPDNITVVVVTVK
jgi:PPM family protein phosphatase